MMSVCPVVWTFRDVLVLDKITTLDADVGSSANSRAGWLGLARAPRKWQHLEDDDCLGIEQRKQG